MGLKPRNFVVLSEPLDSESRRELEKVAEVVPLNPATSANELLDLIREADAVIERKVTITAEAIRNATRLKIVARMGVGVDKTKVDVEEAARKGVIVSVPLGVNSESVAEQTFALLLSIARKTLKASEALHAADRDYFRDAAARKELEGVELAGKTMGVIGIGHVGSRVGEIARAFHMRVLAYDPYVSPEAATKAGMVSTDLTTLLSESDVVTLHLSLTKETEGLLDEGRLRLMKKTAFLINTSRGGVVDEAALAKRLKNGELAGAALDVFEHEPIERDSPLLDLENVVLTPHVSANTVENFSRSCRAATEEVLRVLSGSKPLNAIKL